MTPDERTLKVFGRELRRLRVEAELTQEAVARRTSLHGTTISNSHVSDIEKGKAVPRPWLRRALDEILQGGGRLERLWEELTGSGRRAWLHEVAERTHRADALYEYQALVFPVYLQTEAYSRAVIRYGAPWLSANELAERAQQRARRAQQMAKALSPIIWLVVDQSLLMRRYGSAEVQLRQLEYVADLVDQERINLLIVPVDEPRHAGNNGPFRVITSADQPEVVYVESAHQGQIITATNEVGRYRMWFAALQGVAWGPDRTLRALQDEMKRINGD
ncbi:helix-turn-helix transcriptional regulator [Nocardiopsis sp. MG754419]|uniref:helix-turn-helix domain-containing protein n=1 Tax=Nocardiopsis sp. MG754419 TaxID=2259865 RepID=UPI001BA6EDA6|nr:helix-turn-helix transcriptional regulator [Nocardiopsis sp. MG754419]MBR8742360.1 XRE family transcriptional regulator [Nocardiopsis sp. MG754419]